MAMGRVVRSMGAKAIDQPRIGMGQIAVPDLFGIFGQGQAGYFAAPAFVKQAKLDLFGMGGKHGEIDAQAVPIRAKGIRTPSVQCRRYECHRNILGG